MRSSDSMFRLPPFPPFPSVNRYVQIGSIDEAMTRVCRSVDSREGISLVIGPPGTGKTLLAQLVAEAYQAARETVVLGDIPIASPADCYRQVLHQLGRSGLGGDASDLHLTLAEYLRSEESHAAGLLIIIDEAQALSEAILEAIRMVTNIMRRHEPRVTAVLFGGPKLEETLALPVMESFTQRVATRCYLHPMNCEETRAYIQEAIRRCGAEPVDTIDDEAIASVYHACSGIPRLINQLMTEAVDCAELAGQTLITEAIVDRAWANLQQLPSPVIEAPQFSSSESSVEFGELEPTHEPSDELATEQPSTEVPTASEEPGLAGRQDSEAELTFAEDVADDGELTLDLGGVSPMLEELTDQELPSSAAAATTSRPCESHGDQLVTEFRTDPVEVGDPSLFPAADADRMQNPMFSDIPKAEAGASARMPLAGLPSDLFGQFDEEEILRVEADASGLQLRHAEALGSLNGTIDPTRDDVGSDAAEDATLVPESLARQQAIEIAKEVTRAANEGSGSIRVMPPQITSDPKAETLPTTATATWLVDDKGDIRNRDDSDLVVVEDEIRGDAPLLTTRIDSEEQTISVDFQAMLNKMRAAE